MRMRAAANLRPWFKNLSASVHNLDGLNIGDLDAYVEAVTASQPDWDLLLLQETGKWGDKRFLTTSGHTVLVRPDLHHQGDAIILHRRIASNLKDLEVAARGLMAVLQLGDFPLLIATGHFPIQIMALRRTRSPLRTSLGT